MEQAYATYYSYFLSVSRWFLPLFALLFTLQWVRCLLKQKYIKQTLAVLVDEYGERTPVTSYESAIGHRRISDIVLPFPSVSKKHAVLSKTDDGWQVCPAGSTKKITVNGNRVRENCDLELGDSITFGEVAFTLQPPNAEDATPIKRKKKFKKTSDAFLMIWLSVFQVLIFVQLYLRYFNDVPLGLPVSFGALVLGEWVYYFIRKAFKDGCILVEMQSFFLTTIGFAVCITAAPYTIYKELAAAVFGFILFIIIWQILKNINITMKLRYAVGIASILLLIINLIFGKQTYGARNWLALGPITIQPSEFIKIAFIFTGSATLARLFATRNLLFFAGFSGAILGSLALMKDYGAALIFFMTLLIIIFIRSGDMKTIIAISTAAAVAGVGLIAFMPHIARRFEAWGHVWQYADTSGYQQTRTLIAAASGGLLGTGGGNGYLDRVAAADTDLVFGILCEEWGLIIAVIVLLSFLLLGFLALKFSKNTKSTYYSIAVCAAAGLFIFQVSLNAFGACDILPFTGVTLPFVSNGGSSMVASFGLLAFFKAAVTNQGGVAV